MATEPGAAQRIRDSIAALPEDVTTGRWTTRGTSVRIIVGNGGSISVLDTRLEDDVTDCEPVAKYSALMDPHVGEALANLLEALASWKRHRLDSDAIHALLTAEDALEAAILREDVTGTNQKGPETAPESTQSHDGAGNGLGGERGPEGTTGGRW